MSHRSRDTIRHYCLVLDGNRGFMYVYTKAQNVREKD